MNHWDRRRPRRHTYGGKSLVAGGDAGGPSQDGSWAGGKSAWNRLLSKNQVDLRFEISENALRTFKLQLMIGIGFNFEPTPFSVVPLSPSDGERAG